MSDPIVAGQIYAQIGEVIYQCRSFTVYNFGVRAFSLEKLQPLREFLGNFKLNYLENYNDSEHAVKTKNAPFFMIFPNISFFSYNCKLLDWSFKEKRVPPIKN